MYESYYGLSEKPFSLTPDPRFLYLSHKHKEAFAHLLYGIRNRNGFVMVSGEIGTGKTTICRSLLKQLDPDTEVAFIFNPYLSPEELLRKINQEFGIASKAESVRGLIDELNEHLVEQARRDKNCVLIIDEAQNLATQTLEQIRLLSNLETETQKLLQIVLIGQPELPEKLALWELRQLNQRITARYHLEALNEQETLHYIAFRLRVAGGRKKVQFTPRAIKWVYKLSGGTPRVINAICDRALLIGYTKDSRTLTPSVVRQAAREIQGEHNIRIRPINMGRLLPTAGAITAVAVGVMVVLLFTSGPIPSWGEMTRIARDTWTEVTGDADAETDRYQVEAVPEPNLEIADSPSRELTPSIPESTSSVEETATSESPTPEPTNVAAVNDAPISALDEALADLSESMPEVEIPSDLPEESTPAADEAKEAIDEAKEAVKPEPTSDPVAEPATETADDPPVETVAKATTKVEPESLPQVEKSKEIISFRASIEALLQAWGNESMHTRPGYVSDTEVQRVARAHDLAYTALSVTPGQIELINLPVVVRLKTDGRKRWVALLKTEGDQCHVHDEGGPGIVPRNEVVNDYQGTAYYFWRDPNPAQESLRAFSEGDAVQAVQDQLHGLGIMEEQANGAYDGRTIEAVTRVQRATGLMADGIVGYKTRMVLWAWTESENTPRLQSPVFPALALESVAGQPGLVITRPAPTSNDAASRLEALEVVEPEEVAAAVTDDVTDEVTDEATEPPVIRLTNDSFKEDPTLVGDFPDAPSQQAGSAAPAPESTDLPSEYTPVLPEPDSSLRGEVTEVSDTNIPLRPFEENTASGSKENE